MGICQPKQPKSSKSPKDFNESPEELIQTPTTSSQHLNITLKPSSKIISIIKKNSSNLSTIKEATPDQEKSPSIIQFINIKVF